MNRQFRIRTVFCAAALLAAGAAAAEEPFYSPGDRVTVLMGFSPGGGSDVLAQLVQPYLAEALGGAHFVNQYQPGATGAIAWTQLAHQVKPDGATIAIVNTPMLTTNYIMNDAISYSIADLEFIANVVTDPGLAVVAADSPYQTFEDLIAAARANPSTITVANSGLGGDDFFTSIAIENSADVKFQKVPFKGDGPSWTAAMGGKVDVSFNNLGITYPQIVEGNLRPLVVFTEERLPQLPDVPTARELGYDVSGGSSRGYGIPKGFPKEAREQLIEAFRTIMQDPEFLAAAEKQAMTLDPMFGDDFTAFLQAQEAEYAEIWASVQEQRQ